MDEPEGALRFVPEKSFRVGVLGLPRRSCPHRNLGYNVEPQAIRQSQRASNGLSPRPCGAARQCVRVRCLNAAVAAWSARVFDFGRELLREDLFRFEGEPEGLKDLGPES